VGKRVARLDEQIVESKAQGVAHGSSLHPEAD
jgi:hypothetical protein